MSTEDLAPKKGGWANAGAWAACPSKMVRAVSSDEMEAIVAKVT